MTSTPICIYLLSFSILSLNVDGGSLPWPDFESGWLPIRNGLEHVARLNIDHGLGEVPVLVDVSVKIEEHIFPASGFRPDHPIERSGPVVYIYDDQYVNVSTSPIEDPLYRLVPRVNTRYEGSKIVLLGNAQVRIRAWKQTSLPAVDFTQTGIRMKANTSKVSDSYAEVSHSLEEMPCLVVVRIQMHHKNNLVMADGVGSSMQVYADRNDRTNAYLVYGYSNTTVRTWVDSSNLGAIFDGRKHTWFDMVISEGEAEIFAWKCSTITPLHNARVVTSNTMDTLPEWWNLDVDYDLEPSLVRVSVLAENPDGPNEGFRFPGSMHLGYPEPPEAGYTVGPVVVGGLSYVYKLEYKFNFWQPKFSDNFSTVFIADSFGNGKNTEHSHSESVYIVNWIYEENGGCPTPVIQNGYANTTLNGTALGSHAIVQCDEGFNLKQKERYYQHDYDRYNISCHRFGYWENMPSCIPKEKEVDSECNPAVDKCHDQHAACTLTPDKQNYRCICNTAYTNENGRCKAKGTYMPKADYDSDWKIISRGGSKWYLEFEHGLGTVPLIVDVQVEVDNYVFHAIGYPANRRVQGIYDENAVTAVYIYDEQFVNVSTYRLHKGYSDYSGLFSRGNYKWYGYSNGWNSYGYVRVQAWKADSLPQPDLADVSRVLRANTSKASDSFYELEHSLGEYPGIVIVRGKMEYNGSTFYADGVGSALNVVDDTGSNTNAYLVYGYSDSKFRVWVDSSRNGAIFDGRADTKFDFIVSEATVEIYAWKLSTITPFFTYLFPLDDDRIPPILKYLSYYDMSNGLNQIKAQITDESSKNKNFRFPTSPFIVDKFNYQENKTSDWKCSFGGFTAAYKKGFSFFSINVEESMQLYKPVNYKYFNYEDSGSMLCLPDTFGGGSFTGSAFNAIGILHSWINGDCGVPPEKKNGYLNTTVNGTEFGAMATLECNKGYTITTILNDQPFCSGWDGEWLIYVSCKPVECGEVEAPTNGSMNVSGLTFGNNITFGCDDGYRVNGTDIIECTSSGKWSARVPTCSIIECGEVESPTKGSMNVSGLTFGNNVTFGCDEGYRVDGTDIIECTSSGKWSARVPTCIKDDKTSSSVRQSGSLFGLLLLVTLSTMASSINAGCIGWHV